MKRLKIKINNKPYELQPSDNLTAGQYIALNEVISADSNTFEVLLHVIAIHTRNTINSVNQVQLSERDLSRLVDYVGIPKSLKDIEKTIQFTYRQTGQTFYRKNMQWDTLGVRRVFYQFLNPYSIEVSARRVLLKLNPDMDIEQMATISKEIEIYEKMQKEASEGVTLLHQVVFLLAIMVAGNYDVDKTKETYENLLQHNYLDIFGFGLFFYKNFQIGRNNEGSFLKKLRKIRSTNTVN